MEQANDLCQITVKTVPITSPGKMESFST
jgi:hypothetical protein